MFSGKAFLWVHKQSVAVRRKDIVSCLQVYLLFVYTKLLLTCSNQQMSAAWTCCPQGHIMIKPAPNQPIFCAHPVLVQVLNNKAWQ
jgi:hypothetical protein